MVLTLSLNPIIASASTSIVQDQTVNTQQPTTSDPYEEGLREYKNSQNNLAPKTDRVQPTVIGPLIRAVFRVLAQSADDVVVTATKKNVTTTLKNHAIKQAVARGVTEVALDNLLSEISSGMNAIEKFDDHIGNSRIMYDPNSKLTVVLSKFSNIVITTYYDTANSKDQRVKDGRWVRSLFKFE